MVLHSPLQLKYVDMYCLGDSDDELLDEEPDLDTAMLNHTGGVNRIRVRLELNYNSVNMTNTVL